MPRVATQRQRVLPITCENTLRAMCLDTIPRLIEVSSMPYIPECFYSQIRKFPERYEAVEACGARLQKA